MGERGRLLLVAPVLRERVEAPTSRAVQVDMLMDLNMLVRTGGRERTDAEYRAFLAAGDLRLERVTPTNASVCLVEAAPA